MIDVKKLSVNFLILAVFVGLIAFVFSHGNPFQSKKIAASMSAPHSVIAQNAFNKRVESLPVALRENLSGKQTNLTESVAQNLIEIITALNPNGPQTTADGQTGYIIPTSTILTGYLTMQMADQGQFKLSDLWVSPDQENVTPANSEGVQANKQYGLGFQNIMKGTVGNPTFISQLKQTAVGNTNAQFLGAVYGTFSDAIQQLKALPTPQPFVAFQKDFIVYLENQRNAVAAVGMVKTDPIKSMIVLASGPEVQQRITSDFGVAMDEYANLDLTHLLAQSGQDKTASTGNALTTALTSFIGSLGIQSAQAQLIDGLAGINPDDVCGGGLTDSLKSLFTSFTTLLGDKVPVVDAAAEKSLGGILAIEIFNCKDKIQTQDAKNAYTDIQNADLLSYMQGAGNLGAGGQGTIAGARVIADVPAYIAGKQTDAAVNSFETLVSPNICPQLMQSMTDNVFDPNAVLGSFVPGNNAVLYPDTITNLDGAISVGPSSGFGTGGVGGIGTGCTLSNQVGMTDFYNNFGADPGNNGGVDDYFNLFLDPTNNVYGSWSMTREATQNAADAAGTGATASVVANQGYPNDAQCARTFTDSDGITICVYATTLSPGSEIAAQVQTGIDSESQAILNANSLSQTDAELADGLVTQLRNNPQQGLMNLQFQAGNTLNSVCSSLSLPNLANQSGLGGIGGIPGIPGLPGTNPAQAFCNSTVNKIITEFTKYLNIIKQIGNIIGQFF